jgi:signal transduction histidine kinase
MSLFAISSILVALTSITFGLFLYSQNKSSIVNRYWLFLSITIAFWALGLYGVTTAKTYEYANLWQYLLDISAVWIPISALLFTLAFIENISKERYVSKFYSRISYVGIVITILLSILSTTHYYRIGMVERFDFFWVQPGPIYILFPIYFAITGIILMLILSQAYKKTTEKNKKGQLLSLIVAGLIGFGGGFTNFFPQIFDIYPFGNYFLIIFIISVGYSVLQYKLFDTKIIATQIFSTALSIIFLFNLLNSRLLSEWLTNAILFIFVIFFSFLMVRSVIREVEARHKIERLADDLRRANERLKELDRMKSQFLSIASHDLRAPLTTIRNFMSMLLEGTYGKLPPAAAEGTHHVFERATEMADMVDNYLNVSRIEQGRMKYDFTDIDLKDTLNEAVKAFEPIAKGKELVLNYTPITQSLPARGDEPKLREVIENLILNAINYTPQGSITILTEKRPAKVIITIQDTGIGMSKATLSKLFGLFNAGEDSRKYNPKSTGVGLYITKAHVEAHKGTVRAESEGEGKGSRFIIELPLK